MATRFISLFVLLSLCSCVRAGYDTRSQTVVVDGATDGDPEGGPIAQPDAAPVDDTGPAIVADVISKNDILALHDVAPDATIPVDLALPLDRGTALACPATMASFSSGGSGKSFCIDKNEGAKLVWTVARDTCGAAKKRLCTQAEWVQACNAPTSDGMLKMVGDWEWLVDKASATSAKKRGATSCNSASSHSITSGAYRTRCCSE